MLYNISFLFIYFIHSSLYRFWTSSGIVISHYFNLHFLDDICEVTLNCLFASFISPLMRSLFRSLVHF